MDVQPAFGQIHQVRQRDPRLRPFRAVMWTVYLLAIGLAVGAMVMSIARNLNGARHPAKGALPTRAVARVCAEELDALDRDGTVTPLLTFAQPFVALRELR